MEFVFPKFTNAPAGKQRRSDEHMKKYPDFPDPAHYLDGTQKYFFRDRALRHLRIGQTIRYFAELKRTPAGGGDEDSDAGDTGENTCNADRRRRGQEDPDESHRHYDEVAHVLATELVGRVVIVVLVILVLFFFVVFVLVVF